MTLNGVMAVILRYLTELVYGVVVNNYPGFKITILKRFAELLSNYLGKRSW